MCLYKKLVIIYFGMADVYVDECKNILMSRQTPVQRPLELSAFSISLYV